MTKGLLIVVTSFPGVAGSVEKWYIECAALTFWQQIGGEQVEFMVGFLVSVAAGVVASYICKWLDRHSKGQ